MIRNKGKGRQKATARIELANLNLAALRQVHEGPVRIALTAGELARVKRSAAVVARVIRNDASVYGINTGFGLLANTRIPREQLAQLQKNIVLSHAAGTGPLLDDNVVRLILVLKIASLAQGFSGVRPDTVNALIALVDNEIYPCIPAQGSVGASGDLAPLAHMACALIGVGNVRVRG